MWLWGYDVPKQRREILSSVDLQLFGGSEPQSPALTEDEELLLKLFRQMPEDTQKMYLEVLRAHLKK
jgi:hypothetical protein